MAFNVGLVILPFSSSFLLSPSRGTQALGCVLTCQFGFSALRDEFLL